MARSVRRKKPVRRSDRQLTKFAKALLLLKRLPKSKMPRAIRVANDAFIRQFCSRIKRLKHAKLKATHTNVLRSHRGKLRKLVNKRTTLRSKRNLLSQRGGFLPALIPLVASLAAPLLKKVF